MCWYSMSGYIPRKSASFSFLGFSSGICVDAFGTLWSTNSEDYTVFQFTKKLDPILIAGKGIPGYVDGDQFSAEFASPRGICGDNHGNIYVCDTRNHVIRKIQPLGQGRYSVSTTAGTGESGCEDGNLDRATFHHPDQLTMDTRRNILYVVQHVDHVIRGIDLEKGIVWTVAGVRWQKGYRNGPACQALFWSPFGVAVSPEGAVFVSDWGNHTIRKIEHGLVSTIIGERTFTGAATGTLAEAQLCNPQSISIDENGIIIVTDQCAEYGHNSECIRRIDITRNIVETIGSFPISDDYVQATVHGKMIYAMHNRKGKCEIRRYWNSMKVQRLDSNSLERRWKEVRVLWIGNLKESPEDCVLARLPPELLAREIVPFLLYPQSLTLTRDCSA